MTNFLSDRDMQRVERAVRHVENQLQGPEPPEDRRRRAWPVGSPVILVRTTDEHPQGETQPCTVLTGRPGEETATARREDCYNPGDDLDQGATREAVQVNGYWRLLSRASPGGVIEGYLLADLNSSAPVLMQVYELLPDGTWGNADYTEFVQARGGIVGAEGAYCLCVRIGNEWRPVLVGCV